jgi:hypothetical protein
MSQGTGQFRSICIIRSYVKKMHYEYMFCKYSLRTNYIYTNNMYVYNK